MKSVTIREAQHRLTAILRSVELGEEVQIRRRNVPIAKIVSLQHSPKGVDWTGLRERLKRIYGPGKVKGKPMEAIVSDGRGIR